MNDCQRALLAVLTIFVLTGQPVVPALAQTHPGDPPPAWPTDGCGYWENVGSFGVYFAANSIEPHNAKHTDDILDVVAQHWKDEDRGFILLAGHIDGAEATEKDNKLDLLRAEWTRDQLVARGVPADAIWLKAMGFSKPLQPTAIGVPEPMNRRVTIRNTRRGQACLHERRGVRIEWFLRNCFPNLLGAIPECTAQLKNIEQFDGY